MLLKRIFSARIMALLISFAFMACARNPNNPMNNWNPMMGYGYGGGFMWLLFLVLAVVIIYFLLQASKSKNPLGSTPETPLETLKKRYAKGEIDKEEFDRIKNDLES